MRHVPVLSGLLGAVVIAPLVAGAGPVGRAPAGPAAPRSVAVDSSRDFATGNAGARTVEYRGLRIPVPEGWEVHRLDRDPSLCVRHDRRAIYIGRPGPRPDCPARVVGGRDVLRVEPVPGGGGLASRWRAPTRIDALSTYTVPETTDHRTRVRVPEAGVVLSGRYGPDPSALQDLIRSTEIDLDWGDGPDPSPTPSRATPVPEPEPTPEQEPAPDPPAEPTQKPEEPQEKAWTAGKGFDTCTAPSISAMRAWSSAFEVANMYIGGASRGCAQPNLTRAWVTKVRQMGYRLIPTYVGLQAPCSRYDTTFTAGNAAEEGRKAAVEAIGKAKELGVPEGQPIYYDMEAYKNGAKCRKAVLTFLDAWSTEMKAKNYVPAVYSSVGSAIRDLVKAPDDITRPEAIWFADWDGRQELYGHPAIPDDRWHPHRRIKQYRGGHKETHGGVTINIDSNNVDSLVY